MYRVRAPGRVTLVGEHTDIASSYALPVATDQQVELTAEPATDVTVTVAATDETRSFPVENPEPVGDWTDAVRGCYAVLQAAGYDPSGVEATIEGDLSLDSGLGGQAALEVAVLALLATIEDIDRSRAELAELGHRIRTEFLGSDTAGVAHYTAALSKAGHALFVDTETGAFDRVRLPEEFGLLVFDTGTAPGTDETAASERRRAVADALAQISAETPKEVDLTDLGTLPEDAVGPLGYLVRENTRVRQALGALEDDNLERLGGVMFEAHEDAAANVGASTPELEWVVEKAIDSGAHGARAIGGGQAGLAAVLVSGEGVATLAETLDTAYEEEFPERTGAVWAVEASDGVTVASPE